MKCSVCGKFAKIVDSYTPFGGYEDIDPPDEVLLCQKCVDKDIEFHRKWDIMPRRWIRANYETELAKELGYEWIVEKGCAWGYWSKIRKEN